MSRIPVGSYGVFEFNNHIISFGSNIDIYQAKCVVCEKSVSIELNGTRTMPQELLKGMQYYSFYPFVEDSCEDHDYDSFMDVVRDNITLQYRGKIADDTTRMSIESDIEELLPAGMSHDVNLDDISGHLDIGINMKKPVSTINTSVTVNTKKN